VAAETKYLTDSGIEVACHETLDIAESRDVSGQDPDNIADLIRKVVIPGIDAVLISSINLPSHRVVASLERELGLPVITGATAVIWNVLRLCGRPPVAPTTLASAMLWRHGQGAM
jgi:maleate isomerase